MCLNCKAVLHGSAVALCFRDRISGHDHIATSYIDIAKTSRPGSDESEEDGLYICLSATDSIHC